MVVLFLTVMIAMILIRALRKDIAQYNDSTRSANPHQLSPTLSNSYLQTTYQPSPTLSNPHVQTTVQNAAC